MALGRLPCLRLFKYQITVLNTTKKEKRKINQELCRLRSEFHIMVLCTIFKGSQTVQKLLSTRFTTLNFSEELPEPVTSKPISLASWRRMRFCITVCCTAFLGKLCYPPVPVNMFFIFFSGVLPVPVSRKDSIHPSQELEGRNFVLWYFVPCFGPYAFPCFLSTKFSNFFSLRTEHARQRSLRAIGIRRIRALYTDMMRRAGRQA